MVRRAVVIFAVAACGKSSEKPPPPTPVPVPLVEAGITYDEVPPPDRWRRITADETRDFQALGTPRVVRFAIDTWAGWAPLLYANGGIKPERVWRDAKGGEFRVEIVVTDDPVAMLYEYARGALHIGWGTVDMLPMYVRRLAGEPRTLPRVVQQVSWSAGADGIVARDGVATIADLRKKTVTVAENMPSQFLLLVLMAERSLRPDDVDMRLTADAFLATQVFESDDRIDAAVGWLPEIDRLAKAKGNHLLASTADRKLVTSVWFARGDFAAAHPDVVKGIARGIAKATTELPKADASAVATLLAGAFRIDKDSAAAMLKADASLVSAADSRAFLLDPGTGFRELYAKASELYAIDNAIEPAALVDGSLLP